MNLSDLIPVSSLLIGSYAFGFLAGYGIYLIRRSVLSSTN
jgi:hypothetical protein